MTEELGFDEGFRDGAAGDSDKGLVGAGAEVVNGAGDQFLAGAAFAGNQNRGIEIGYAADQLIDALHGGAGSDDAIALFRILDARLRIVQLLFERRGLAGAAEHGLQVANRRRPARVAKGAGTHQLERRGTQTVLGHEDGRDVGSDEAARARDARLQRVFMAVQIEEQDIAASRGNQGVHPLSVGLEQNLEVFPKSRGKERLQRAVLGINSHSGHDCRAIQLAEFTMLCWRLAM